MCIGCGLIFYGIGQAIDMNKSASGTPGANDGASLIAILSTASGVIINLIAGTFMAIYNSTLKQAIRYTDSLQKTSTVGTSLAILQSIEESDTEHLLTNDTKTKLINAKIDIAKQLISLKA